MLMMVNYHNFEFMTRPVRNERGRFMKYDLLLVDNDGTLMDFDASEKIALRLAMEAQGVAYDDARQARYSEINRRVWEAYERRETTQAALQVDRFRLFLEALGSDADFERMAKDFMLELSRRCDEIEGAYDFVREAAARVPVVVITNGVSFVQHSRFSLSRMTPFFRAIVISGDEGVAKPDPQFIDRALARIDTVDKSRALILGDSLTSDIAAANASGVAGCWFNPHGKRNTTAFTPDYEIRSLKEALEWL